MLSDNLKNLYLVGTGAALCTAGVVSANNSSWVDSVTDISHILTIIAPFLGASGVVVAAIGLTPIIIKYGKKIYEKLKEKCCQRSQEKENQSRDDFRKKHLLKRLLMRKVEPETLPKVPCKRNARKANIRPSSEREI